jgi:virulence-associated protein VagC
LNTASLTTANGQQTVVLPMGISLPGDVAEVRTEGSAIILEPARSDDWPAGFFEDIRIEDPAFTRPDQGLVPPAPSVDA